MRTIILSRRFKKDFQLCLKRGLKPETFEKIAALLANDKTLPASCRPHKLGGNYSGYSECHLAPDWLLVYQLDDGANEIIFVRTGTHSDLFT
ncbi:MAG: type II toxin-antitoxin system YafQ family toxin [Hyphomicrobiales bacterium]|nr:type II toxin-antitoxin system YafQ family toxin [Hyphomicrobiales bacterium]